VLREEEALLLQVYSDLINGFGVNHSKIYFSLLSSEVKTAGQVIEETGVCKATVYSVLKDLIECGLINCSNSNPRNYFILDPVKVFNKKVEEKKKALLKRIGKLEKVIANGNGEESQEFLIKIGKGNQTKIINAKTKEQIKDKHKALEVKKQVEEFIRNIPEKRNYCQPKYC